MRILGLMGLVVLATTACAGCDTTRCKGEPAVDGSGCNRWIFEGTVTNARDIGGWPLVDGNVIRCARFYRGGALGRLDSVGCAELESLGIRTVVDLRDASSQSGSPPPACVTARAAHVSAPMPKLLPDTVDTYLALLEETVAVRAAFGALTDPNAYPVYAHCEIGRARVSFLTALILLAVGAERGTILQEFNLSQEAGVVVVPAHIEAVMNEIERRGGIVAYLASCGVGVDELAWLKVELAAEL